MAKLSGKLYLVVGLGIVLLSYFINSSRTDKSFVLFMLVGAVFMMIGIVKEISSKKKSAKAHDTHLHQGLHPKGRTAAHKSAAHQARYCHSCGAALRHYYTFCPHCGARVR